MTEKNIKLTCYWEGVELVHTDNCTCDDEYQAYKDAQQDKIDDYIDNYQERSFDYDR